jgi:hypothetical protein
MNNFKKVLNPKILIPGLLVGILALTHIFLPPDSQKEDLTGSFDIGHSEENEKERTPQSEMPDLIVESVNPLSNSFEITIKNIGTDIVDLKDVHLFSSYNGLDFESDPQGVLKPQRETTVSAFIFATGAILLQGQENTLTTCIDEDPNNPRVNVVSELDEENNCLSQNMEDLIDKPDLVITDYTVDHTYGTIMVDVSNIGPGDATGYAVQVYTLYNGFNSVFPSLSGNLPSGSTVSEQALIFSVNSLARPNYDNIFTVCVDEDPSGRTSDANKHFETNELNNCLTVDFNEFLPPEPNLSLTNLNVDLAAGEITVEVVNDGDGEANYAPIMIYSHYNGYDYTGTLTYPNTNRSIPSGEQDTAKAFVFAMGSLLSNDQDNVLTICVDEDPSGNIPANDLSETDEKDNCLSQDLDLIVDKPDLIIDGYTVDNAYGTIMVDVSNIGPGDAIGPAIKLYTSYNGFNFSYPSPSSNLPSGSTVSGQALIFSVNSLTNPNSDNIFTVCVDEDPSGAASADSYSEADESNNCLTVDFDDV